MNGESSNYDNLESLLQVGSSEPHNVPLEYLRNITNNFSSELLLGEGGFGTVYKGVQQNGETIAVKKLRSSIQGVRHFENEARHLMRLKHPNVVLLVGWCFDTKNIYVEHNGKYICAEKLERLLCLEYMPKGSLREFLSDESSGLGWDTRYKIIQGICDGLRYLHEELDAPIAHMDLKPANILLDNNMVPKIADFGLSRLFGDEKTRTYTISRDGTLGYMSPEYINRGLVSTKSDIFSLGVIIIEMVTGRKDYPYETGTSSKEFIETVLSNWARRNGMESFVGNAQLEVDYPQIRCSQITRCIQIGLDCVKIDRYERPTISEIISRLDGLGSDFTISNIEEAAPPPLGMVTTLAAIVISSVLSPAGGVWPDNDHLAGDPMLYGHHPDRFTGFFFNTMVFAASVLVIMLLMSRTVTRHAFRSCALWVMCTGAALIGLTGAFSVGSSRSVIKTSIYVVALVVAVQSYLGLQVLVFFRKAVANWVHNIQDTLQRYLKQLDQIEPQDPQIHAVHNPQETAEADQLLQKSLKYLLLVGILAASVTYQAGLNPPRGSWQAEVADGVYHYLAGDPVLHNTYPQRYLVFFYINATAFVASLLVIVILFISNVSSTQRKYCKLQVFMIMDFLGLIAAYAVGSFRQVSKYAYVSVLVISVFLYVGIHVMVLMLEVFPNIVTWRKTVRDKHEESVFQMAQEVV